MILEKHLVEKFYPGIFLCQIAFFFLSLLSIIYGPLLLAKYEFLFIMFTGIAQLVA